MSTLTMKYSLDCPHCKLMLELEVKFSPPTVIVTKPEDVPQLGGPPLEAACLRVSVCYFCEKKIAIHIRQGTTLQQIELRQAPPVAWYGPEMHSCGECMNGTSRCPYGMG